MKKARYPSRPKQDSGAAHQNHGGPGAFSVPRPPVNYKEKFLIMSEIEKMKRYIERTKMDVKNPLQYAMNMREAFELAQMAGTGDALSIEAISIAFNYGQAKGYRAAKTERRAQV